LQKPGVEYNITMQYSKKEILVATILTLVIIILCVGAVGLGFSVVNRMTISSQTTATGAVTTHDPAGPSQLTVEANPDGSLSESTPTGLEGTTTSSAQGGIASLGLNLGEVIICVVMIVVVIVGVFLLDRVSRRRTGSGLQ
jgi:hypothetical protein